MPDGGVVIIVPSQGDSRFSFLAAANTLNAQLYGGAATIVKTKIVADGNSFAVKFTKLDGKPFRWGDVKNLTTVITISHAGACDGPNLACADSTVVVTHQPWGSYSGGCEELSDEAKAFWKKVGLSLGDQGKIIMLGCELGKSYANLVKAVTGKKVYASMTSMPAGHAAAVLKHVTAIEYGEAIAPMKQFKLKAKGALKSIKP